MGLTLSRLLSARSRALACKSCLLVCTRVLSCAVVSVCARSLAVPSLSSLSFQIWLALCMHAVRPLLLHLAFAVLTPFAAPPSERRDVAASLCRFVRWFALSFVRSLARSLARSVRSS